MPATPETPTIHRRKLHALSLPEGSVRAVLALMIFGMIWAVLAWRPDRAVPDYLSDLMFVIMGHYFAVRRRTPADGPGPPPLYLPRGTIRLVLIGGFIAVGVLLYRQDRLSAIDRNPGVMTLMLAGGFLMGVALAQVGAWMRDRGHRVPRFVEDIKAFVALVAALWLLLLIANEFFPVFVARRAGPLVPLRNWLGRNGPERVLSAVVGFYFGTRS